MGIQQIRKDHKEWLDSEGESGKHANLREADLRGAKFCTGWKIVKDEES